MLLGKCGVLLALILLSDVPALSQTLQRPLTGTYTGLGAYSLNHTDVFSVISNPASLSQLKNISFAVYNERRFFLKELNSYTAVGGLTTHSGNFALRAGYSGFTGYNETRLGIVYGRKLGSKMDIGAGFHYHGIRISSYGSATAIGFELGSILHISDKLHTGIHITNPVGGKFGKNGQEKLSSLYSMGWGYEASGKFFVCLEIEKEEDQPVNVTGAVQYRFVPQLAARAGISTASSSGWAGVGLILRSFRVDLITSYHPQLGISPGLLVLFGINKTTK